MSRSKDHQQGFTLVELMIVVAIVGILAVLATVGYRRYIASSKYSEASQMVNAIRIAQETVKAETGAYVNLGITPCPQQSLNSVNEQKWGWSTTCSGGNGNWSRLPVHADGAVYFGYITYAGAANTAIPAAGAVWDGTVNGVATFPNAPTMDWYVVVAVGDVDGDRNYGRVIGASMTNDLFIDNEGN